MAERADKENFWRFPATINPFLKKKDQWPRRADRNSQKKGSRWSEVGKKREESSRRRIKKSFRK